jgi:hypothetical protein
MMVCTGRGCCGTSCCAGAVGLKTSPPATNTRVATVGNATGTIRRNMGVQCISSDGATRGSNVLPVPAQMSPRRCARRRGGARVCAEPHRAIPAP